MCGRQAFRDPRRTTRPKTAEELFLEAQERKRNTRQRIEMEFIEEVMR